MSETYPAINSSDRTPHTEVAITQPGVLQYTIYIQKSCHCTSDIMIVDNEKEEDLRIISFSKRPLVGCVVFNLLILWPQVPIMFKTVM